VFRKKGVCFSARLRNGDTTIFQLLTASTAVRTRNSPRYAGAYVYSRQRYGRNADGKKTLRRCECTDWLACIPSAHPVPGTDFSIISKSSRLMVEVQGHPSVAAPRGSRGCCEAALCAVGAPNFFASDTLRGVVGSRHGTSVTAHTVVVASRIAASRPIEGAIGALIAEKMRPAAVEFALEIRREIEARYEEADRLRHRAIERTRIEADLAQCR
jgi:hypothetical protein